MTGKAYRLNQESIVLAIVLVVFVLFSLFLPGFLSSGNIIALIRSVSVLGILGLGMATVVLGRGIDVSMIATMVISVSLALALYNSGQVGFIPAIFCGAIFVVVAGLVIGILISYAEVPAIFATLAMSSVIYGIGREWFFSIDIQNSPDGVAWFQALGRGSVLGLPMPIVAFAAVAFAIHVFLSKTRVGRFIYAMGDNPATARASGLPVRPIMVAQYVLSGLAAYIAGLVMAASVAGMNLRLFNSTMIYDVLLVVVLGGIGLSGGHGKVRNVIVGTLFVGLLINGMTILNFRYTEQNLIKSIVLLVAIIADAILNPRDEQTSQQGDI